MWILWNTKWSRVNCCLFRIRSGQTKGPQPNSFPFHINEKGDSLSPFQSSANFLQENIYWPCQISQKITHLQIRNLYVFNIAYCSFFVLFPGSSGNNANRCIGNGSAFFFHDKFSKCCRLPLFPNYWLYKGNWHVFLSVMLSHRERVSPSFREIAAPLGIRRKWKRWIFFVQNFSTAGVMIPTASLSIFLVSYDLFPFCHL